MPKLTSLFCNKNLSLFYFAYNISFYIVENGHYLMDTFCLEDGIYKKESKETHVDIAILT